MGGSFSAKKYDRRISEIIFSANFPFLDKFVYQTGEQRHWMETLENGQMGNETSLRSYYVGVILHFRLQISNLRWDSLHVSYMTGVDTFQKLFQALGELFE